MNRTARALVRRGPGFASGGLALFEKRAKDPKNFSMFEMPRAHRGGAPAHSYPMMGFQRGCAPLAESRGRASGGSGQRPACYAPTTRRSSSQARP